MHIYGYSEFIFAINLLIFIIISFIPFYKNYYWDNLAEICWIGRIVAFSGMIFFLHEALSRNIYHGSIELSLYFVMLSAYSLYKPYKEKNITKS
jgi:hypothetical protein